MKKLNLWVLVCALCCVRGLPLAHGASPEEAEEAANKDRLENILLDMDCAVKKDKLFFDYLAAAPGLTYKNYKFRCARGKETITMPVWFELAVTSMSARELEIGKEKHTEARLWQEPFAVLGEFHELIKKTLPVKDGGIGLHQRFLVQNFSGLVVRYEKAVQNLGRAKLAASFEGRGDAVYASLVKALYEMDGFERSFETGTPVTFYEKSLAILGKGEEAFAAVFTEAQNSSTAATGAFSADYRLKPKLLPGYRAVALELPAYQLEGVNRGDFVDLIVTIDSVSTGTTKGELVSATVLQNSEVLSVSKPQDGVPGARGSVRLLLKPIEAQYAALSMVQGKQLALTVRAEGDAETKPMDLANFRKIIK